MKNLKRAVVAIGLALLAVLASAAGAEASSAVEYALLL